MKSTSIFTKCSAALLSMLLFSTQVFALNNEPDIGQPDFSEPDAYTNTEMDCRFIESYSLFRPCQRRFDSYAEDAVPQVGRIDKHNGELSFIVDIRQDDEYRFAIEQAVRNGYFELLRGKFFLPYKTVEREEFIAILIDVLGLEVPANTREDCFGDIRKADYKKELCFAHDLNWVDSRVQFYPEDPITKAAAAKILMHAFAFPNAYDNINDTYYEDVSRGTWYARFINAGRKYNIFPDSRRFYPGSTLTRKEASLWFYNLTRFRRTPTPVDVQILDVVDYTESTFAEHINSSRRALGLREYQFDPNLYQVALMHSQQMAQHNSLTHGNLNHYIGFLGQEYRALGENIALLRITGTNGLTKRIEDIHNAMINEEPGRPNHRANIYGTTFAFTHFAVAAYEDKDNGRVWITQVFAVKRPNGR